MHHTIWRYRGEENPPVDSALIQAAEGSELLAKLLWNRGLQTPNAIKSFLNLKDYQPTDGMELPDMEAGLERIAEALDNGENILVYGDFDVDGQTGTAILMKTLTHLAEGTDSKVSFYIPDRDTEGHGLNATAVCKLVSSRKVKLVITTDTGITDFNEISLLKGLGVDTIVTDHHDLPENLPPSVANINPKLLPDKEHPLYHLCGAGVAYKLCELLLELRAEPDEAETLTRHLLGICAIGTVVDMMPLVKENRWLVWKGLQILNERTHAGVNAILEQAGVPPEKPLTSETIGFTVGPRLNALGRLERADDGVTILTSDDPDTLRKIAARLEALNRKRQDMCEQNVLEAERHLLASGGLDGKKALILGSDSWHPGIIGLVATRLKDKFNVPVFMMIRDDEKGEVRCSARSIDGFHLHKALEQLKDYFLHYGGHAGAGGFALKAERLDAFKQDLFAYTEREITAEQMRPVLEVDAKIDWPQLTPGLVELVDKLAPCGMANPSPLFVLENALVGAQRPLGESGNHLKLILSQKANSPQGIEALIWNHGSRDKFDPETPYHFVVSPELNSFRGQTKVQLIVKDVASPTGATRKSERAKSNSQLPSVTPSSEPLSAVSESSGAVNWIDHRSREGVEAFVGQLMLPLQDGRSIVLYHEGQKPEIPFLDEGILVTRTTARPSDELIFWDVPPDARTMRHVMDTVSPKTVHLVCGKFQKVPTHQPGRAFLKVIYSLIKTMAGEHNTVTLEPTTLAWQLATTPEVILSGLVLLEQMALMQVTLPGPGEAHRINIGLKPTTQKHDVQTLLAFIPFQQALRTVGLYRDFVITAPLDTIRASLAFGPDTVALPQSLPAMASTAPAAPTLV